MLLARLQPCVSPSIRNAIDHKGHDGHQGEIQLVCFVSLVSFVVIKRHDGQWKVAYVPGGIRVVHDRCCRFSIARWCFSAARGVWARPPARRRSRSRPAAAASACCWCPPIPPTPPRISSSGISAHRSASSCRIWRPSRSMPTGSLRDTSKEVKRDIERMFSPGVIRQAHRQIDMAAASPGLAEVALLDRMIDLIVEREQLYDLVVFDTAPTGHTLQLLRMPEAMTHVDSGARQAPARAARNRPRFRRRASGGRAGRPDSCRARATARAPGSTSRAGHRPGVDVVRAGHNPRAPRD